MRTGSMLPHPWRLATKHAIDAACAALLLILLSPLLAATALAVWAVHKRPILFRQRRPGYRGRPFTILKFRTMRNPRYDGEGDAERLTGLGRLLRATSIDELPELINVVRGEMSLVGPRPLRTRYLTRYTPEQARRHDMRPGITGWAQVNGRNQIEWGRRLALDCWYVDRWSFTLDLNILAMTIPKVFAVEGIAAADHATMPEFLGAPTVTLPPPRPRRRPARGWLRPRPLVASVIAIQLTATACVAAVDPYGVIGVAEIDGINDDKTRRMEWGARVVHSLRINEADYDTLILGGSRSWAGLDPAGPALRGMRAYNAAVPEATMAEIAAIGRFALQQRAPRRVIIGLSLSMFEADRVTNRDFEVSGFDGDPIALVYARTLLTPAAVRDAARTVYDNLKGVPAADMDNGLHRRPHADPDHRRAFDEILAREYLVKPWRYARFEYDRTRIALLAGLIRDFARAGTEVHVYIPPVHSRQIEAMAAMGVYPVFERWLADLAVAITANNRGVAGPDAILWDFTGYDRFTTEPIPDRGAPDASMRWYWNSSLHRPALGELVLERMLGTGQAPADFGTIVRPDDVNAIIEAKRRGRTAWLHNNPREAAEIRRLVRETAKERAAMIREHEMSTV